MKKKPPLFKKMTLSKDGSGGWLYYEDESLNWLPRGVFVLGIDFETKDSCRLVLGYGHFTVSKDDLIVYTYESQSADNKKNFSPGAEAERLAAKDPDHDWRACFQGPGTERYYQRQARKKWALYEKVEK